MKTIEYKKIEDLIQKAAENSLRISDIILEDQSSALEETKEQCFERMQEHLTKEQTRIYARQAGLRAEMPIKYTKDRKTEKLSAGPSLLTV